MKCPEDRGGVDLNRNFGYKWGHDNEGSSPKKCAEDYRGPTPFSEPETRAIRDFLNSFEGLQVKIALNFHAYGNLFIMPFNYDSRKNNPELKQHVH